MMPTVAGCIEPQAAVAEPTGCHECLERNGVRTSGRTSTTAKLACCPNPGDHVNYFKLFEIDLWIVYMHTLHNARQGLPLGGIV